MSKLMKKKYHVIDITTKKKSKIVKSSIQEEIEKDTEDIRK